MQREEIFTKYWEDPFLQTRLYQRLQKLDNYFYGLRSPLLRNALAKYVYLRIREIEIRGNPVKDQEYLFRVLEIDTYYDEFNVLLQKNKKEVSQKYRRKHPLEIIDYTDAGRHFFQAMQHEFFILPYLVVWFVTQYVTLDELAELDKRFLLQPVQF